MESLITEGFAASIPRLTDPRERGVGHFSEEKTSQSLPPRGEGDRLSRVSCKIPFIKIFGRLRRLPST
jgi:hypothetical protein